MDKISDAGSDSSLILSETASLTIKNPRAWLANASEIKELWYDQGLGELLEAGIGFGARRDVGDLQFVLRGRDGREVLTTVRRLLDEYNRTGDWYFNAIVSSASVGNDACEIFKKYDAHNLPE